MSAVDVVSCSSALPSADHATSSRPTTCTKTSAANTNGVHSFFHHFAPPQLPRTEPVQRTRQVTTLRQHLRELARESKEKLNAAGTASREKSAQPVERKADISRRPAAPKKTDRGSKTADDVAGHAPLTDMMKGTKQDGNDTSTKTPRKQSNGLTSEPPPRLSPRTDQSKHHDLDSFLAYATTRNMDPASTWYRGTNYEYAVQQALAGYHFKLHRTGRANDLGIDLLGEWSLPQDMAAGNLPRELKVLIQCKLSTGRPCNVRELEGAYVGAPAGWRGAGVMAFLVSAKPATPGVRGAMQRSRLPMGFLQVTEIGQVQQFIWNHIAHEARLTGMSTTHTFSTTAGKSDKPQSKIALVYQGRPL
ncbi:hypothetical protein Slin15195_G066430 [Septoria linicola]|uniref:Required for respiratory growth protein 7, mitochondrial n=1 Tax=Septoria linicola TaxID=215465 RepID=A0A9Q9EKJ3_9PEZI|nr:hypothetical protein Slin14017_G099140 [Septoria linicola]USW53324.1 hypothetical protein Slin15195_G066430 [Septoria linicola]